MPFPRHHVCAPRLARCKPTQCKRLYATAQTPSLAIHTQHLRGGDCSLNQFIISQTSHIRQFTPLLSDHHRRSGHVLPYVLPYDAYPDAARRADASAETVDSTTARGDGTLLVVHMVMEDDGGLPDFVVCSGFVIDPQGVGDNEQILVTCSHTLDQISLRYPQRRIHSFILPSTPTVPSLIPINSFLSSSVSDLLICSISRPEISLRALPVSPFSMYKGQDVLVHDYEGVNRPGKAHDNGLSRAWKKTEMMGYRGYNWRDVLPGTSSSLPYITYSDRPTSGSSGGPIVDAQSGAVVGVVSGSRTMSAVEGERGYGSSAENIFELFTLPGFVPSSAKYRTA